LYFLGFLLELKPGVLTTVSTWYIHHDKAHKDPHHSSRGRGSDLWIISHQPTHHHVLPISSGPSVFKSSFKRLKNTKYSQKKPEQSTRILLSKFQVHSFSSTMTNKILYFRENLIFKSFCLFSVSLGCASCFQNYIFVSKSGPSKHFICYPFQ
jgi:hypothetical protein